MRISEIEHQVTDVENAAGFYRRVLQLPATVEEAVGRVVIGSSVLKLVHGPPVGEVHHLAFDIPAAKFAEAKKWLSARVPLLRGVGGVDELEGPRGWDSRSLYFSGPDDAILELIARRRLRHATASGEFSGSHLVNISEIGVAVDNVSAAARRLEEHFDAPSFGPRFDEFDPVGDESGLFVLVATGRAWMPDQRQLSGQLPLRIHLDTDDATPRSVRLSEACTVTGGRPS